MTAPRCDLARRHARHRTQREGSGEGSTEEKHRENVELETVVEVKKERWQMFVDTARPPPPFSRTSSACHVLSETCARALMAWLFGSPTSAEGVGQTVAFGKRRVKLQRQLAEGGYAVVFEGVDARTRERFAVKRIITADEESRERAEHEVAIHEQLGSEVRHVVGYHGCARLPRRDGGLDVFLLLELCAGGHLWTWCTREGASAMGARQRLSTLAEIADGLTAMHALPLAHNDLKLENVLVREGGSVALCDFGSASPELTEAGPLPRQQRLRLQDRLERFTTPMYRAPEMVDLYSELPVGTAADL